ncbi:MAG: hypothetical protein B7O98_06195 [Zestosphaera tikiterensis]|uniref:OBG-type G domain-containing protein n=1 Tax=Zestosphaera tikiterensis TaxID=1973259 RepID=A0A2R7Y3W9_9CREN|nr:MAG: hypothetical protein B7O98_06195 [Zestosphaera tikiterensis]
MEEACLSLKLKNVRLSSYEEVRENVLSIYSEPIALARKVKKKGMLKTLTKLDKVYHYVDDKVFKVCEYIPKPDELPLFYVEILSIAGITDYASLYGKLTGLRRTLRRLWKHYRLRVKLSLTVSEARKDLREFIGRTLSIVRRIDDDLRRLNTALNELRRLPCIEFNQLKVVVAGMPQVGKSTLVRTISSAKPEVSPFPFTTKNIILGHVSFNHFKFQIIDTPGILDRPLDELNDIERRALTALKFLADVIVFMIDPRPSSYYPLNQQLDLLKSFLTMFKDKEMIVVINKIDEITTKHLEDVLKEVNNVFKGRIFTISALHSINLNELVEYLRSKAYEYMKRTSA